MAGKKFDTSKSVWGELANNVDIMKQFLFDVRFEYESDSALAPILDKDDFMIKARSASIPQKSFNELETNYMGTKLLYPGKATITGDFTVTWDEFQDNSISIALHKWANLLMNQGFNEDIGGSSNNITGGAVANYASAYCCTVELIVYDSTLKNPLPIKWRLYRVWPKSVNGFQLDHNGDSKVTREATFSYSNFEVIYT